MDEELAREAVETLRTVKETLVHEGGHLSPVQFGGLVDGITVLLTKIDKGGEEEQ